MKELVIKKCIAFFDGSNASFEEVRMGVNLAMAMCDCEWSEDDYGDIVSEVYFRAIVKTYDILFA